MIGKKVERVKKMQQIYTTNAAQLVAATATAALLPTLISSNNNASSTRLEPPTSPVSRSLESSLHAPRTPKINDMDLTDNHLVMISKYFKGSQGAGGGMSPSPCPAVYVSNERSRSGAAGSVAVFQRSTGAGDVRFNKSMVDDADLALNTYASSLSGNGLVEAEGHTFTTRERIKDKPAAAAAPFNHQATRVGGGERENNKGWGKMRQQVEGSSSQDIDDEEGGENIIASVSSPFSLNTSSLDELYVGGLDGLLKWSSGLEVDDF